MSPISRRKLLTGGALTVAGVAGLAAADRIARRHGLIPPDGGGIYGPGETLTYAAQRVIGEACAGAGVFARDDFESAVYE